MNIEEFFTKKRELESVISNHGKALVSELFQKLFDTGKIKMVVWSQYTPYFMDGDPCVFSLNTPAVVPVGAEEAVAQAEDDYGSWWPMESECFWDEEITVYGDYNPETRKYTTSKEPGPFYRCAPELVPMVNEFYKNFWCLEDVMLASFGDHATITATQDENGDIQFSVEHCEHD